ncbi:MAG: hypothetical protein J5726_03070, partial [Treponema sp.]|nr:hypothetical protein [Treponema sp.]
DADILGQFTSKKQIISGLYQLITKTKIKPAVLMLYGPSGIGKTESAKSIKRTNLKGAKSRRLLDRQKNKDPLVVAYADKCRLRLSGKIVHLEMRGKPANVATTAAARELACFIWGMMTNHIA